MDNFTFIDSKGTDLNNFIIDLQSASEIYIDVETTGLDVFSATWLLFQVGINDNIYILDVRKLGLSLITYIVQLIKDGNKKCIGHNVKFDVEIIFVNTKELLTNLEDTMLMEVLINQGIGDQFYSLDDLVQKYILIVLDKKIRKTFENYDKPDFQYDQLLYSALDVKYLKKIRNDQITALTQQKQLGILELENGLIPVTISMELNGVLISKESWMELKNSVEKQLEGIQEKLLDYIIESINFSKYENALVACESLAIPVTTKRLKAQLSQIQDVNDVKSWMRSNIKLGSPQQMKAILNLLNIPVESTGEKVLKDFKNENEIVSIILDFREKNKKLTTYGEKFIDIINPITGRIHVDFNQLGTKTGRYAVSRLHQIPRENEYRRSFVARHGYKIITADYDQAELRLLGSDSGEPKFIDAYKHGIDLHKLTASFIFNKDISDVTKDERYIGKTVNFAVVYGTTEYGLYFNFGIPLDDGRRYLNSYFSNYPVLSEYLDYLGDKIWEKGFVPSFLGRRRYFERKTLFTDSKEMFRYKSKVLRELRNTRIQGTCADMIKMAMLEIARNNPFDDDLRFLLQVHDEVVLEVKDEISNNALDYIKNTMLDVESKFLKNIDPAVGIVMDICWKKG